MSLRRIIHTADCHGTQAVYDRLHSKLDADTLFLDAGDAIAGSNTAFRLSEPNLQRLSELGCRAMTMGNRELHYLPWILERRAEERNFPLLAANLVELWGRQQTWQEGVSLSFGETRVGVFGMTVVQYPVGSLYEKAFGLRFLPPETLIEQLVEKYQKEHDLVIFLSHLGVDWDRRLARQLMERPDLKCDFILGGHTHVSFEDPEVYGHTRLSHIGSHSSGYGEWVWQDDDWHFQLRREAVKA
ncbi:MAG: metallophosphoesterase [Candidatus Eremiobacteraeota bacterium]|nr:metallophosphoesterase [Candidatus Eremiobacteraeota bacterium]